MTRTPKWPVAPSHDKARCYSCDSPLDGSYYSDSGNAHGHGKWMQTCPQCGRYTWYDLKPEGLDGGIK